ncbi:MAG: amino acid adenylation domain-containing protein, partial [bacterium]|nr:amino acid adenylation domain-containing protein [bacterium]
MVRGHRLGQNVKERAFWQNKFAGELERSSFPPDRKEYGSRYQYEGKSVSFALSGELSSEILKLSKGVERLLHVILTSGITLLLNKYTGNTGIVVGTPIYKQEFLADFINTVLPLKNSIEESLTFKQQLMGMRNTIVEAQENQNYPIEILPRQLGMEATVDGFPLFDTAVLLGNIQSKEYLRHIELNMTFSFLLSGGAIEAEVEYNSLMYAETTIKRIFGHFIRLLSRSLANPRLILAEISLLSPEEKNRLLYDFNDTESDYPREKTIHQLFEEQVEKLPGHTAVVYPADREEGTERTSLSYGELNRKAHRLANLLREKGVGPDCIVALSVNRSPGMIAGIMGILKAGGAYLPIDPGYPEERIRFMLKDSDTKVLVSGVSKVSRICEECQSCRLIDIMQLDEETSPLPVQHAQPSSLAYVIYTSGTTGKPKGVLIEHRNVVRLMINDAFQFSFSQEDVWSMFHSFCFDFSVWEIYGALLYGGRLIMVPGMVARDTSEFLELLKEEKVTVLNQIPSAFYNLIGLDLDGPLKATPLDRIRYVIFGGEALKPSKLGPWKEKYPQAQLINMYGITETTVHVTYKEIGAGEVALSTSNIGRPIPTLSTYILDKNLGLVPLGVAGELCVGGEGLGRGYLNRQELTREKFTGNPNIPGEKLYRSGDLARWLPDGDIEYLGRIDHQVKIRGFRIELGEIESLLLKYERIKEAIVTVIAGEADDKSLCAYIVPRTPEISHTHDTLQLDAIKEYLEGKLPPYMVPPYIVTLEKIPLTSNGKVDRKALPAPGIQSLLRYTAPRDPLEEKLVEIWAELLGVDGGVIGIDANFFQLGGHSLKATIMASKIHREFNSKIPLAEIFKSPTIRGIAQYIRESGKKKYISIEPVEKKEYYAVSSPQKRLYILQQIEIGNTGYNMPYTILPEEKIDMRKLEIT